jgi:2-polyprenyl-3-methyl-5-hydroxy-6-metoxy-1,4-benzoquinol methylase
MKNSPSLYNFNYLHLVLCIVACGTGGYSLELAKQGYNVTAVDLDAEMVEKLKNKNF